jgi:hypothetical protein
MFEKVRLIKVVLLVMLLSSCGFGDYVRKDEAGEVIDCAEMIGSGRYIKDFEIDDNYLFNQCRAEILEQQKTRCDSLVKYYIEGWRGRSDLLVGIDVKACALEVDFFLKSYNREFKIVGNTLQIDGVTLHKNGLVVSSIGKRSVFVSKWIYRFSVLQGGHSELLEFSSKSAAEEAHAIISAYLSI